MNPEQIIDSLERKLLGTRLRDARKSRHLTQAALGKILGVSKYTVCRWERGALGIHPLRVAGIEEWIAGE